MKLSTRVRLVVIGALLAAMFIVGSAWADEASVVKAITDFGLARKAGETGNTITILNSPDNATLVKDIDWDGMLDLGDISGLTIDWQANLTVTGELENSSVYGGIKVIMFKNGTFNMTAGVIDIQTIGVETNAIETMGMGSTGATITVDGATITGTGALHTGFGAESGDGTVIVKSGKINFPNGLALTTDNLEFTGGVINGLVSISGENDNDEIEIYGTTNSSTPFDNDDDGPPAPSLKYTVKSGAVWTVSSDVLLMATENYSLLVEEGGEMIVNGNTAIDIYGAFNNKGKVTKNCPINVYGSLINVGTLINNGTINNYTENTIDNQGTLTNNGTINNLSMGKITSSGTIDNTNGTIKNDGTFQSVQTKEQMGGKFEGKAIEPIEDNPDQPSGSSSGCNAGFGLFGLAVAALTFPRRK